MDNQTNAQPVTTPVAAPMPEVAPTPTVAPDKYPVRQAVLDTLTAIRNNPVTYVVSILVAGVISIVTGVVLVIGIFAAASGLLFTQSPDPGVYIGLAIGSLLLITVWYALAGAFMQSYTALALYAGAGGQRTGVGETLWESFRRMKRVVLAQILMAMVTIWPLVVTIFIGGFSVYFSHGSGSVLAFLLPIAGIIWLYIALLRFVLAPYVAMFEPDVPIRSVLSRSSQLMAKGGQWFLIKGIGAMLLVCGVVAVLLPPTTGQMELYSAANTLANLIYFVVSLLASGVIVMLYRNRKLVKG